MLLYRHVWERNAERLVFTSLRQRCTMDEMEKPCNKRGQTAHLNHPVFNSLRQCLLQEPLLHSYASNNVCERNHPCYERHTLVTRITPLLWASRPFFERDDSCDMWQLQVTHVWCLSFYGMTYTSYVNAHMAYTRLVPRPFRWRGIGEQDWLGRKVHAGNSHIIDAWIITFTTVSAMMSFFTWHITRQFVQPRLVPYCSR